MSKKILLVEDDDDIAALLRLNLQDEGYQIASGIIIRYA